MTKKNRRRYVISIDSSSSACKTSIVDLEGRIVSSFSLPIKNFRGEGGVYEHDPEEIWENQLISINRALEDIEIKWVIGIAITNQRETIVAWDSETKKPICRAISWQDSRNDVFLEKYREHEDFLKEKTGLKLSSYFSVSKIAWILKNTNYSLETLRVGTIDTWLIANLTNHRVFATDITNASRTMLMDLRSGEWDDGLLELFGIPKNILPKIFPSGHLYGFWEYKDRNIPIFGVIGDQQASLLCGAFRPNTAKNTYGTGLFLMINTGISLESMDKTITTVAWKLDDGPTYYALECGSLIGGNYIKDLRESGLFSSYSIENNEFEEVVYAKTEGNRVFTFDDVGCLDCVFGIGHEEKGERILKGALTFIALIMNEMISVFRQRFQIDEIIVGGNLTKIDYLNKLQASISSVKLRKLDYENNSALGAAYLVFMFLSHLSEERINYLISKKLILCGEVDEKPPLLFDLVEKLKLFKTHL